MAQTTRSEGPKSSAGILYVAIELSKSKWGLTMSPGGTKRSKVEVPGGRWEVFDRELAKAKQRMKLPTDCRVVSCYEAGRDGFWVDRRLRSVGIENRVLDSSSIEVPRRNRRAKTDRLDGEALLRILMRYESGEKEACSVVRVPGPEEEDARRGSREMERLKKERQGHRNRIGSLLALEGISTSIGRGFLELVGKLRRFDGSPLCVHMLDELKREYERLELVERQIREKKGAMEARLKEAREAEAMKGPAESTEEKQLRQMVRLQYLKGIGRSAEVLVTEFFGWREFKSGREVGSLAGLTGTPYRSGEMDRDQGISKAGNWRVRGLMIELAWVWVRHQRGSKIARWFQARTEQGNRRMKRVAIVAVARKLLVALWRYLETGELPEGAVLKGDAT